MLKKIFALLDSTHKREFYIVGIVTVLFSIVEIIGISLIMPFVQIASNFDNIHKHETYQKAFEFFGFSNEKDFVLFFGMILILFYIFRAGFNLYYYRKTSTFIRGIYFYLALKLFKNYIGMDYRNYIERNSSHLVQVITAEADNLSHLLHAMILIFGEVFIVVLIYGVLLYVNWKLTLLITLFLLVSSLLMLKFVTKKIKIAGDIRADEHRRFHEILANTFGNFKMIKLQTKEDSLIDRFELSCEGLTKAYISNETLQHVPRLMLEAMSFILVIGIILYWIITYGGDVSAMIGVLTLFIVALYRLMPSFNRIMTNYNNIEFYKSSLKLVENDIMITKEERGDKKILFKEKIELKNLTFSYENGKKVLDNINLTIQKGQKVAFIGESGGGKSTLVDIIIGLLKPDSGEIYIDGVKLDEGNLHSWREKIGYIPQDVYLFDASVAENVAFAPRDEVDEKRVVEVLKKAQIYEFLENHQEGIDTIVGEGGVKLSGGQKQRIAIARALYHDPEILVMDEATSALDDATEKAIMERLYEIGKDKTMIMIAHRLSTIEECDVVYRVEKGRIESA